MFKIKRIVSLLLVMAMLAACMGAGAEGQSLKLPAALRVIGEEAFEGLSGAEKVELPEGVQEIGARAFANSGVREINLPGTLVTIAENAFDGTALVTVTAEEGTYAYDWAVAHGYIEPYVPVTANISVSAAGVRVGDAVTWTVSATGGEGSYLYTFELYRGSALVTSSDTTADNTFTYTFADTGSYRMTCRVKDDRREVSVTGGAVTVAAAPLSGEIACSLNQAEVGDYVVWTANAVGGTGSRTYYFELFRDGRRVGRSDIGDENFLEYTFNRTGTYYVTCKVTDDDSEVLITSGEIVVTPAQEEEPSGLTITGLNVDSSRYMTTETQTWEVEAEGGVTPYRYSFSLSKGGDDLSSQSYSTTPSFQYTFFQAGDYTLTVKARDAEGTVVTEEYPFTVDLEATRLTGVVRIYVDVDSRGRVLESNDNTGHYELQIDNNGGNGIVFDNYLFDSPVFSFHAAGGSTMRVHDPDTYTRSGCKLYTFEFTTTADKVDNLLNTVMASRYLDIDSESESGGSYVYDSKITYSINSNNCFTAVAAWCSLLGYGTLTSIVNKSTKYTDYIAWKMFDKYGSAWDYIGDT